MLTIEVDKYCKGYILATQRRPYMAINKFAEFTAIIEAMEADFEKFYDKEVGAAGTRVRKHCQDLAKLCKETRNDVTAVKNARKEVK